MGILTGIYTLVALVMIGWLIGSAAKSGASSVFHYYPKRIQLDNWLQIGEGKICRVIWSYHDEVKRLFYARLSIGDDNYMHVEAKTKDELEQKVKDVFESL